jgi:glycosyltransferase involved in cell wall biosynthesis
MKILYVDQTGQLGGGELALLPWLTENSVGACVALFEDGPFRTLLEDRGIAVKVLALNTLKSVRRESGIVPILRALPVFFSLHRQLAKLASGFEMLYANSQKAFLVAAMTKRPGQPLVWHLRDILTGEHFHPILRKIAVFAGNRYASVIIANSHATAESFIAAGGRRDKVRVVHDGVSPQPFDSIDSHVLKALGSEVGSGIRPTIGLFGRLSPWKGQHILLEALSGIPDAHAVLVGDALFGETEYAETLWARARQPDIAGRVHFLGFRQDIPGLMRSMDMIVHTSTSPEPFGLVIVEAMLARKPVIATRAGGAVEIIRDGTNGLLVSPGSVPELRAAIQRLLADSVLARRLGEAGRSRAEEAFSQVASFEGISGLLQRLEQTG